MIRPGGWRIVTEAGDYGMPANNRDGLCALQAGLRTFVALESLEGGLDAREKVLGERGVVKLLHRLLGRLVVEGPPEHVHEGRLLAALALRLEEDEIGE